MTRGSCIALFCTVLLAWGLMGCDWVTKTAPDTARVRIEGAEGTQLRLVTSTTFLSEATEGSGFDDDVTILDADTTQITLPFEETFDIRRSQRFLAQVRRPNPESDALFMRAWIDGDEKFTRRGAEVPADSIVQFTYVYQSNSGSPGNPSL